MAGKLNQLNARQVETLKEPGRYSDGGNLYLSISPNGGKRWIFSYRFGAPKPAARTTAMSWGWAAQRRGKCLSRMRGPRPMRRGGS